MRTAASQHLVLITFTGAVCCCLLVLCYWHVLWIITLFFLFTSELFLLQSSKNLTRHYLCGRWWEDQLELWTFPTSELGEKITFTSFLWGKRKPAVIPNLLSLSSERNNLVFSISPEVDILEKGFVCAAGIGGSWCSLTCCICLCLVQGGLKCSRCFLQSCVLVLCQLGHTEKCWCYRRYLFSSTMNWLFVWWR